MSKATDAVEIAATGSAANITAKAATDAATAPISLFGLVMGKFLAAFLIFLLGVAVLLVYALFLAGAVADTSAATGIEATFGWASVFGNLVGISLMGAVYISAGIFISSLTENQMIAAIGSIGANIALCLFDVLASYVPWEWLQQLILNLSVFYKYQEFTYGIFSLKNIHRKVLDISAEPAVRQVIHRKSPEKA